MFYDLQPLDHREDYKKMLAIVGSLSRLFSDSDVPSLYYRAHENIFCKFFEATNLAREDCSADASLNNLGIGLKTWVGRNDQKIAEFGKLKSKYENLTGMDLVREIAILRNRRIRTTMNVHGLKEMIYHVVKRVPQAMQIYETAFDMIDIDNIVIYPHRGSNNNTYFSDGKHTYHFSTSKNTLYMMFENMELLDSFDVDILDDPYEVLSRLIPEAHSMVETFMDQRRKEQICLRLYSTMPDGTKFVGQKSGLNQWNGVRTSNRKTANGGIIHTESPRDPNELYIPYPAIDRRRTEGFFPPRDTCFDLLLPDGEWISAKICQAHGKAIMSNPNNKLGEWLLRKVFELKIGTVVTYEMLMVYGIDSVVFTKLENGRYMIDFCTLGTYEEFYGDPE